MRIKSSDNEVYVARSFKPPRAVPEQEIDRTHINVHETCTCIKPGSEPFDFQELAKSWSSPLVAREEISRFSGGVLTPRYLANLDAAGKGPPVRLRIGRKIAYPVSSLILWLKNRSSPIL
jgi:hypothetical protein